MKALVIIVISFLLVATYALLRAASNADDVMEDFKEEK